MLSWLVVSLVALISCCVRAKEGCVFQCKNPEQKPYPQPSHVANSNGCGSLGISFEFDFDFEPCCHFHDLCYDTCSNPMSGCDEIFLHCMNQRCENNGDCLEMAQKVFEATTLLGCKSYLDAQKDACVCMTDFIADL